MKIKEYYEEIRKKKGLPEFNSFNSEFGIDEIEGENFSGKIAEKIVEKIGKFKKLLEEFINSDGSSLAVLIEIKGMNEKDKEMINDNYKELILIERSFLLAELNNKDDSFLDFITKSLEKWNEIKPNLKEIITKAKESWKDELKVQEKLGYLG